jgi:hypothetical protein
MARKKENNRRDEMENSMVKVDVTCRVGHFGLIEVRSGGAMRSAARSHINISVPRRNRASREK